MTFENKEKGRETVKSFDHRLREAVKSGDIETIQKMFKVQCLVDAQDNRGKSAIHYAATESTDAVVALLAAGANAELRDDDGKDAFDYAKEAGNTETVELLRKSRGSSALHHAAETDDLEKMKELLNSGVDLEIRDSKGFTPLDYSVTAGKISATRFLLNRGAKISTDNIYEFSSFHAVAATGNVEMMNLLLDHGTDIDLIGYCELTPLHAAIQKNQSESVKLLIERGANVYLATEDESSPFFLAALYAGVEIGEMLIEAGAEIDDGNPKKRTPLHASAVTGNVKMLNLLLEKYPSVQHDDALFEESDDQDEPPLIGATAITINKDSQQEIAEIIGNPSNKRWSCAVHARRSTDNYDHELFREYHAGALLYCIGYAPNEQLFLKLVKRCLRSKRVTNFEILSYCESPVGSLREDVEKRRLDLEQKAIEHFQAKGEANPVFYLFIPSIQRY